MIRAYVVYAGTNFRSRACRIFLTLYHPKLPGFIILLLGLGIGDCFISH